MRDFDGYYREKKKQEKAETNAYIKGMLASSILFILVSLVSGAFSDNTPLILVMSVCVAFGSLPSYWLFAAALDLRADKTVWWHLPMSAIAAGIVSLMLANIFSG